MGESAKQTNPSAADDGSAAALAPARKERSKTARIPESRHAAAALIIGHDHARHIAATVRAARAIPGVDLVLVVDDASTDNTQDLARKAGAVVVRHSHNRGRSASIETGASVIAMRDEPGAIPRAILLLDGSLGNYAIGAAPLVPAVTESMCDVAIGLTEAQRTANGPSARAARKAIENATNWTPEQPLNRIRCVTRPALEAAMPLARGAGLEVAMTLDVIAAGFLVTEVECEIRHKPHTGDHHSPGTRGTQYRDVMLAISNRRLRSGARAARRALTSRIPRRDAKGPAEAEA